MAHVPTQGHGPAERLGLDRARRGDAEAFEALVRRHRDRVYGVALRLLNSPEDAARVCQLVFLGVYRQLPQLKTDAELVAWARKTTVVESLVRLRQRRAPVGPGLISEPGFGQAPGVRGAVERAAAALAVEHRAVLVLRDLEGASYQEIAELTDSSVVAVKGRLHQARLTVRAALARFYADAEGTSGSRWTAPLP